MEKKNRFVFNIGFNEANPDHRKVADILNRLGHGKAEYLAKTVLFYEQRQETSLARTGISYEEIEAIVKKILTKEKLGKGVPFPPPEKLEREGGADNGCQLGIKKTDMQNVLQALDSFKR